MSLTLIRRGARWAAALAMAFALAGPPALARELAPTEAAALSETVESFEQALRDTNVVRLMETLPPRLLDTLAERLGVSIEELLDAVRRTVDAAADARVIEEVTFDAADLYGVVETADGFLYGFVPLRFVHSDATGRYETETKVLALRDDGVWYLLRVQSPDQEGLFALAYPTLADIEFTPETSRQLE